MTATLRAASGSSAENLFISLFEDVFGAEKTGYLYSQYPFYDIYQDSRFADFLLENGGKRIAIEIDDDASHLPGHVSQVKHYDDLTKQNSMIHMGWAVYRWPVRIMQEQPDRVKDELRIFLGSQPTFRAIADYLPTQRGKTFELKEHQQEALDKLTAKLRDAVPVCLMVDGKEVKRYKNIEIPEEIKRLPFIDFKFDVPTSGAITFKIHFAPGVLPEVWPEARQRQSRRNPIQLPEPTPEQKEAIMAEVEAALMAGLERADAEGQPVHEVAQMVARGADLTAEIKGDELIITAEESDTMEIRFGYTGDQRKELVKSIGEFTGQSPVYQNAPSFAYRIGEYKVDKKGTLTGPNDRALCKWLHDSGFEVE